MGLCPECSTSRLLLSNILLHLLAGLCNNAFCFGIFLSLGNVHVHHLLDFSRHGLIRCRNVLLRSGCSFLGLPFCSLFLLMCFLQRICLLLCGQSHSFLCVQKQLLDVILGGV